MIHDWYRVTILRHCIPLKLQLLNKMFSQTTLGLLLASMKSLLGRSNTFPIFHTSITILFSKIAQCNRSWPELSIHWDDSRWNVEQFCDREREGIGLLPFYRVCCTQEAFNPAARCAHANHRVLPFINKTESSFLGCLASQKNFKQRQIGWPVSRFFAFLSFSLWSGKIG